MEWLANISVKGVLLTLGLLLLARTAIRRYPAQLLVLARELLDAALIALVIVFLVLFDFFMDILFKLFIFFYTHLADLRRFILVLPHRFLRF